MPVFEYDFTANASLDAVRRFHHETRALKRLTPPPVIVQIHRADPLGEGSVSHFTMWFGPLPINWVAVHSGVGPQGFTDTQVSGPMKFWQHTHRFTALDERHTRVDEHIEYEYPDGIRGILARLLFSPPALRLMFAYRAWVTRRLAGNEQGELEAPPAGARH